MQSTHYALVTLWLRPDTDRFVARGVETANIVRSPGKAGEFVTMLGGHPSLKIGPLLETHQHDIGSDIPRESLGQESSRRSPRHYELLKLVEGKSALVSRGIRTRDDPARNSTWTKGQHRCCANRGRDRAVWMSRLRERLFLA